jgi:hypothetical protein
VTISEQATVLRSSLADWVATEGGEALIAIDMAHLWEMAYQRSNTPKVIVCFTAEQPIGGDDVSTPLLRVERTFTVCLTRGRAATVKQGALLVEGGPQSKPLYDLMEGMRDSVRRIIGVNVDAPSPDDMIRFNVSDDIFPFYAGTRVFPQIEGTVVDALLSEFKAQADLGKIQTSPPASLPIQLING